MQRTEYPWSRKRASMAWGIKEEIRLEEFVRVILARLC